MLYGLTVEPECSEVQFRKSESIKKRVKFVEDDGPKVIDDKKTQDTEGYMICIKSFKQK